MTFFVVQHISRLIHGGNGNLHFGGVCEFTPLPCSSSGRPSFLNGPSLFLCPYHTESRTDVEDGNGAREYMGDIHVLYWLGDFSLSPSLFHVVAGRPTILPVWLFTVVLICKPRLVLLQSVRLQTYTLDYFVVTPTWSWYLHIAFSINIPFQLIWSIVF